MVATAKGKKRAYPLSQLLGVTFGVLTATSIFVVLALTVLANTRNTYSLLNIRAEQTVRSVEMLIDAYLEPAEITVRSLGGQIGQGQIDFDDTPRLLDILRGSITATRLVVAFEVYDMDLKNRGVFRVGSQFGVTEQGAVENPAIRRAIAAIGDRRSPVWGPLVLEAGQVHANVVQPIYRDDTKLGYLVAALPLPRISQLLSEIAAATEGIPFILDGPDNVLAHPLLAPTLRSAGGDGADGEQPDVSYDPFDPNVLDATNRLVPAAQQGLPVGQGVTPSRDIFEDRVLRAYDVREPAEDMFESAAEKGIEVSSVDVNDDTYIMMTRTVDQYATRPWIVGVYFPRDQVGAEIRRLIGSTTVGFLLLVIAAALAFSVGRRIGRPVAALTDTARHITTLDFDAVKPLPPSRISEFNESATVLNSMVDALRAFSAYVPRALVSKLISMGVADAARSQERELTLIFTDIAGFTSLSENMSAAETAMFLNDHFAILCAEVETAGGTVDKFMGDGMMAFWGAPDPMIDHAEAAVAAARGMATAMARYNEKRQVDGLAQVRLRIGIHTGRVIVGNIGPSDRVNYTIVGDTVNACQRLEALGKVVDPETDFIVLLSADTATALGDGDPARSGATHLSAFHVPGRAAPIDVYKLDV
ncbi:MAG: adenylate/guanylate cyclase domain-containing protein [Pseudomonadota bacterium]